MKELEFLDIVISDFKEFQGEHTITLWKLGLGVHFVSGSNLVDHRLGSNGAGKSSIWDALCWCLYGRTVSGLRGTDIRTWGSKEQAIVRVMIRVDGTKFLVVRSTKTNGLWVDGKVVEQAAIDELLGLSYAIFPHTILLGQGEPLFFDLPPMGKMALLSETLDLDRWIDRSRAAKLKVDEIDKQMREMSGRRSELERQATECEHTSDDLDTRAEAWDAEQATIGKSDAKALTEARKALAFAAKEMGDHDLALDGAETEARASRSALAKIDRELVDFGSTVGAASAGASSIAQLLVDLDQKAHTDTCPTCGQSLQGAAHKKHKADMNARIKALEAELKTARNLLADLQETKKETEQRRAKVVKALRVFEDRADDARDNYTRAKSAHAEIAAKIAQLEAAAVRFAMEKNPYSDLAKKARVQVRRVAGLLEEMDELLKAAEAKRERVRHWVDGFKQIRLYSLQEALDELTGVTQTLLPQVGLDGWIVEFQMERETQSGKVLAGLNVNILKPDQEKAVKWESWSGGEGQRLRLVGAMALSEVLLRRAGIQTDLLILDEPTRHLSPEGVDEMVDFLCDRGKDYQIFYIDHQAIETKRFAAGLHVVKDKHGSRIELD